MPETVKNEFNHEVVGNDLKRIKRRWIKRLYLGHPTQSPFFCFRKSDWKKKKPTDKGAKEIKDVTDMATKSLEIMTTEQITKFESFQGFFQKNSSNEKIT